MKIGLVLEGGGMRGMYTIGVLDHLLDSGVEVDYVIGVSAGAVNGVSYVSKQRGRGYRINTDYIEDKRYVSVSNFLKTGSLFGMDFLFDEIPHKLNLFDYETFLASPTEFVTGVTDVVSGTPVYFDKSHLRQECTVLRASSSIPLFSPVVPYRGGFYLDGGTSDPIPVRKALADGCDKVIVVLTRDRAYQKSPESLRFLYRRMLKKYPKMMEVMDNRHVVYNETLQYVRALEAEGKAIVIAPESPLAVGRFEKKIEKLTEIYEMGAKDGGQAVPVIREFLGTSEHREKN